MQVKEEVVDKQLKVAALRPQIVGCSAEATAGNPAADCEAAGLGVGEAALACEDALLHLPLHTDPPSLSCILHTRSMGRPPCSLHQR